MLREFQKNIETLHLLSASDTILVGVSGGVDSVVLLDLLDKAGYSIALAHCNFKLRGEASDLDMKLVAGLARKYDKPLYTTEFDTVQYAGEYGISIEMAARELRYKWFEEIRADHHFDWIAVAHHRDDQLETFFLNLARGTGLQGLTGMSPVNGKIIRPLLFAPRKAIEAYRFENHLEFREDCSNQDLDYQRNKIRHQLIPLMEELNPSFRGTLSKTMGILQDVYSVYQQEIAAMWSRVSIQKDDGYYISIRELRLLNPLNTCLFEFLKPFRFNGDVVTEIIDSLDGQPGKQFFSPTHRLIVDRDYLMIRQNTKETDMICYLEADQSMAEQPVKARVTRIIRDQQFQMDYSPRVALIDFDKLQFPLLIRKWKAGDYFRPLGMKGFKKVSDYFIDGKFSLADKERTWILANGEQIIWIMGHRLDDRYKITPETKEILRIELLD